MFSLLQIFGNFLLLCAAVTFDFETSVIPSGWLLTGMNTLCALISTRLVWGLTNIRMTISLENINKI